MSQKMFMLGQNDQLVSWERSRFRSLKENLPVTDPAYKADEKFLETLVSQRPELLGIGDISDETDIEGPFVAFPQIGLTALNGRVIYPDLVLLWQSGHVVVVEVKLVDNPELRDRQVVAQLLEYAASLAQCSEEALLRLFGSDRNCGSWPELVGQLFPAGADPQRLARRLLDKFRSARLHLIIACDEAPPGLKELVRGIVGQSALGEYTFRVVEIMPYVSGSHGDGIVFVPHTALSTEIVGRTSVTVSVGEHVAKPEVTVTVTPLEEQEAVTRLIREGSAGRRMWTEASFFDDARARTDPQTLSALVAFLDKAKRQGWEVRCGYGREKGTLSIVVPDISDRSVLALYSDGALMINLANLPDQPAADLRRFFLALPGVSFSAASYPSLKSAAWVPHLGAILDALDRNSGGIHGDD